MNLISYLTDTMYRASSLSSGLNLCMTRMEGFLWQIKQPWCHSKAGMIEQVRQCWQNPEFQHLLNIEARLANLGEWHKQVGEIGRPSTEFQKSAALLKEDQENLMKLFPRIRSLRNEIDNLLKSADPHSCTSDEPETAAEPQTSDDEPPVIPAQSLP